MQNRFERMRLNDGYVNIYETHSFAMGFTELGSHIEDISGLFPGKDVVRLIQTHSDIIRLSSVIVPGENTEGDGIILDSNNRVAVIETADCTPLFFWTDDGSCGGVVHIGWQGLLKSLEKRLLEQLRRMGTALSALHFFLGPAIEKECYEVGPDLFNAFSVHGWRDGIFASHPKNRGKYIMDVGGGIIHSLEESGIGREQVERSSLCTFCEASRFPSYRRHGGSEKRIYSFLALGPRSCRA